MDKKENKDFLEMLQDSLKELQGGEHDSSNANTTTDNTGTKVFNTSRGIGDLIRFIEAESQQSKIPNSSRDANTNTDNGRLDRVFQNEGRESRAEIGEIENRKGTSRAEGRESRAVSQRSQSIGNTSQSIGNIYNVSSQLTATEQSQLKELVTKIDEANKHFKQQQGFKAYSNESLQHQKETYFEKIKFHIPIFKSTLSPNQKEKSFNAILESKEKIQELIDKNLLVLNENDEKILKNANEMIEKYSLQKGNSKTR